MGVPRQPANFLAGYRIPEIDRVVRCARRHDSAIARGGQRINELPCLPLMELLAGLPIPEAHRVILPAGSDVLAVGRPDELSHVVAMVGKLMQLLSRCDVPEANGRHFLWPTDAESSRNQCLAIGTE